MKKIISTSVLFFLLVAPQTFAQLESIKDFPRAYDSQEIWDLTPVWISNNEILVFYKNSTKDTIFSRRTTNTGQTWSNQKFELAGEEINSFYYDMYLFKTSTGRLLFFWASFPSQINFTFSDDSGMSWREIAQIYEYSPVADFSITQMEPNLLLLSFLRGIRWGTYLSTDNGETWFENFTTLRPPHQLYLRYGNPQFIKLSFSGDSLLAIFSSSQSIIYSQFTSDRGITWSDTTRIIDTKLGFDGLYNLLSVKTVQDINKNIWLIYDRSYYSGVDDYNQKDVSVLLSSDNGSTWEEKDPFTSYLGDDNLTGATSDGENIFVCFNSSRNEPFNQGFYGIVGQSNDTNTPPLFIWDKVVGSDYEKQEINYQAKVIDDEGVLKVVARLDAINRNINLYDDGMHNDSLANDNIFGNILPQITQGNVGVAYAMDINQVVIPFNNRGVLADVNIYYKPFTFILQLSDVMNNVANKETTAGLPISHGGGSGGKFEEGTFLFASGFWLSGYSNGVLWSNAVASSNLVEDYLPGMVGSTANDPQNSIYVVNKRDVPFSLTWQNWKDAVSLGAEFYDGDGDGIYNPVDKNWNGTWDTNEDIPPLIGDEIAWCVYNDGLSQNQRRWNTVAPQGIEVRQTIFASDDTELENVIFIRYSILNTGLVTEVMDSVFFGIWEDGDLGDWTDDVVGCDTLLNSGFYYQNAHDYIYGDNCPAFFSTLLQGPIIETNESSDTAIINYGQINGSERFGGQKNIDISAHVFMIGADPNLNDPGTAIQARNYILGRTGLGQLPDPCTFPYGQVRGGVDCNHVNPYFWFSGDRVANIGWISTQNRETRNLVSTGPFNLEKDKPQEIIIAYILGRGIDHINSITVARENVQRAIEEYESNFASMTYTAPPPVPVIDYILYQNYPNPFNPTTTIRYELSQDGQVTIEIFDILGQKVKTVLNEYKKADRYEVTFTSKGLASGVYIYQLRVNDFITSKKMLLIK